ncbi:hypothetical protein GCM10025734_17990 [Kitasatospora paranensis]
MRWGEVRLASDDPARSISVLKQWEEYGDRCDDGAAGRAGGSSIVRRDDSD